MRELIGKDGLILLILVVILFQAKRLPDAARSIGRSIRIFKSEMDGGVAKPNDIPADSDTEPKS